MPKPRKKELVPCHYFLWRVGLEGGSYRADGRSNPINAGRHSLGTSDKAEALAALRQLDAVQAVKLGLADRSALDAVVSPQASLSLEEGRRLYEQKVGAAEIAGGASEATQQRYKAVLDKFLAFAQAQGLAGWEQVKTATVRAYATHLARKGYAERTLYMELTLLKQLNKWLIEEGHLAETCRIRLKTTKPTYSSTHCYSGREVDEIIRACRDEPDLDWLGNVCTALACTGLRISELAGLRWSDIDLADDRISITNIRGSSDGRRTKNRRDRFFPIARELRPVLEAMPRSRDGRVFHGPRGGRLKPDTVRNVLRREVLPKVRQKLQAEGLETQVHKGRLHSFRHYFCSTCANCGVPEQMVMNWLGHQDSRMVRYYYHLADDRARQEMARLQFVGATVAPSEGAQGAAAGQAAAPGTS